MAVTGTGTQADPWIVHSYDEFMSLKDRESDPTSDTYYIQFFDTPNQTIDCNTYGSEFKWHTFDSFGNEYKAYHINLNGCTIKNFLIADGEVMFPGGYAQYRYSRTFYISNGAFRNVFLGSATSKFCTNQVNFQDVSISFNFAGTTVTPFEGNGNVTFDNCAMYLVGSTLQAPIITRAILTDTDIELHIGNLNGNIPFSGNDWNNYRESLCVLAKIARVEGNMKDLYEIAMTSMAVGPCSEICLEVGIGYYDTHDYINAKNWLNIAMTNTSPVIDPEAGSTKPRKYMELMKG